MMVNEKWLEGGVGGGNDTDQVETLVFTLSKKANP